MVEEQEEENEGALLSDQHIAELATAGEIKTTIMDRINLMKRTHMPELT